MTKLEPTLRSKARRTASLPPLPVGVLRARSLVEKGISRQRIEKMTAAGKLLRLGRGIYSLPDSTVTENHDLAEVAARVPIGVVCLTSALQFHGLTTVSPWQIHLMLRRGARCPKIQHLPLLVVYASGESYRAGVEDHIVEGVPVKVTTVAKTVADCFKYRSKVGLDVAIEALKQALTERRATRAEIRSYARICRVENVMRPYMEALSL